MEIARITHRRPSASSINSNSPTSNNASDGLLEEIELTDEHCNHRERKHEGPISDGSRWLRPLGLVFGIFLLAIIITTSLETLFSPSRDLWLLSIFHGTGGDHGSHKNTLGIQLNPSDHVSRSAQTITHHWTITTGFRFPDGVRKEVYLVNGQFPGPTIECRSGDRIVVHVTNELGSGEGVSIHWHGLYMRNSNHMDGALGFTQCAIPPRAKFTYEFDIDQDQSGTFWWHAHSQVQRGDGMYGGLIVHKPAAQSGLDVNGYSYKDEVLLLIGDWYHRSADEVLEWYTNPGHFGNEVS
jgi:FtsP/CotA-like multicopper oxidase with cupredoxin domain